MKYIITHRDDGVDIDVADLDEGKEELIEAFQACREGRCSCPTQEYEKVEAFEIHNAGESIHVSIKTRQGENIEQSEIANCLEHASRRVSGD
jgi:hypothetical protein